MTKPPLKNRFKSIFRFKVMNDWVFDESIFYTIRCDCDDGDDDMNISFEMIKEDKCPEIALTFYKNLSVKKEYIDIYKPIKSIKEIMSRVIKSFKYIFGGNLEYQGTLTIMGEKHINSVIEAFEEGRDYIKERVKENGGPVYGRE